jgi:hypothetical protein
MNLKSSCLLLIAYCLILVNASAQPDRWQQRVKYSMVVDVDVNTNRFTGKQKLEYSNNSPDALKKVFYHLYWNAFQPNSSMDIRSQELGRKTFNGRPDWDGRVRDRISKLKENEIGYQKVISLKMNGVPQPFVTHETILEVDLLKPVPAKSKVIFEMEFEAQVPLQIRRSGRDNPTTGVRYSMSQWYPKMCEYDYEGWHPTPYVAREFYGVWGDYEVTIRIDKDYKLGASGLLLNANEIGWGYDSPGSELKPTASNKRNWHFSGINIHDFVWAADPDYRHLVRKMPNGGPVLNVIYHYKSGDTRADSAWNTVADAAVKVLPFMEEKFGKYPYPQYSFIQGGDGGMEYPMATLISGPGLGAVFHEWMHSSYAANLVSRFYYKQSSLEALRESLQKNPGNKNLKESIGTLPEDHSNAYSAYYSLVKSGVEEPMTTHSDHYNTNLAYSGAAYSKGEVFLEQLGYIVGAAVRDRILLEYYRQWRFKHPNATDFIRVCEQVSGLQLDWYKEYWINTTKTIDYGIDSLWEENGVSKIRLRRIGQVPMPIDLQLTFKDGSTEMHYIPMNLMFGEKPAEHPDQRREVHAEWKWTHPTYIVEFKHRLTDLKVAEIDPTKRMADVERKNNLLELTW